VLVMGQELVLVMELAQELVLEVAPVTELEVVLALVAEQVLGQGPGLVHMAETESAQLVVDLVLVA